MKTPHDHPRSAPPVPRPLVDAAMLLTLTCLGLLVAFTALTATRDLGVCATADRCGAGAITAVALTVLVPLILPAAVVAGRTRWFPIKLVALMLTLAAIGVAAAAALAG